MGNNSTWASVTANLYKGVLIQVWCNIAVAVFAFIGALSAVGDMANGDLFGAVAWGFWDYMELAASLGAIYGFWVFFSNINPWKEIVNPADAKAIGSIYTATLLQIIAIVLAFIPFVGIVGVILSLVAWILLLLAYSNLKNSTTFPTAAREGAGKIFTAMILNLVGAVIAWIPFVGIIGSILSIVALVMTLNGWKLISEAE